MDNPKEKAPPPYVTYKSFLNFINGLRQEGMPSHITRSMLPGSNSGKATMSALLKSMRLINADNDEPTQLMKTLVDSEVEYSETLKGIVMAQYDFLSDPNFNIKNTTTEKVAEKFKEAGVSGSTVTKCMAFLLAACKDAGIEVSRYVKTPTPTRNPSSGKKKSKSDVTKPSTPTGGNDLGVGNPSEVIPDEMEKIIIPLRGMEDGLIYLPDGLEGEEVKRVLKAVVFNLKHYYQVDDSLD